MGRGEHARVNVYLFCSRCQGIGEAKVQAPLSRSFRPPLPQHTHRPGSQGQRTPVQGDFSSKKAVNHASLPTGTTRHVRCALISSLPISGRSPALQRKVKRPTKILLKAKSSARRRVRVLDSTLSQPGRSRDLRLPSRRTETVFRRG